MAHWLPTSLLESKYNKHAHSKQEFYVHAVTAGKEAWPLILEIAESGIEKLMNRLKIGALLLLSADICGFSPRHPPSRAEGLLA
eukprot:scaffold3470_cov13-Tisochrysis_lutea.AAC.1